MSEAERGPVEYQLVVRVEGEKIHDHSFWPDAANVREDMKTMEWHLLRELERRGLRPNCKTKGKT